MMPEMAKTSQKLVIFEKKAVSDRILPFLT
jgi:hypothetical protein